MSETLKYYTAAALGCALWIQFSLAQPAIAVALLAVFFTLLAVLVLLWSALILYSKLPSQPMLEQPAIEIVDAPQQFHMPTVISNQQTHTNLPGIIDYSELAFSPTKESILLGVDSNSLPVTATVSQLCHVALLGSTGGGKSNALRLIIPQIIAVGGRVALADPHYTPYDAESGDDWRTIEARLIQPPATTADQIQGLLEQFVTELDHRLQLRREGKPVGKPLFLAFDELPVIAQQNKNIVPQLARILREGRKVHLLTIGSTQSLLVKDLGGSSVMRDQYRTALYLGGDRRSASALLDLPERSIDDSQLGKGVALLKTANRPADFVRLPLVSNQAVDLILSQNPLRQTPETNRETNRAFGFTPPTPKPEKTLSNEFSELKPESQSLRATQLLESFRRGEKISDIVKQFYGVSSGPNYNKARDEVEQFIREQVLNGTTTQK